MGQFTEQVQGILSEQQIKRKEREQRQKEIKQNKIIQENIKQLDFLLYQKFETYFRNLKNYKKAYLHFLAPDIKDEMIYKILETFKDEEEKTYAKYASHLELNYYKILNKARTPYMINYTEIMKRQKEAEKKRKEAEKLQTKTKKKNNTGINLLLFAIGFTKGIKRSYRRGLRRRKRGF